MRRIAPWFGFLSLTIGCADILGLDEYRGATSTSTGGAGGTTASTGGGGATSTGGGGATASGGTGGATTGGTGGATGGTGGATGGTGGATGGTGGVGGGGCTVGAKQPCYEGPAGTENVGVCAPGQSTCLGGDTWGPCEGAVTPTPQLCGAAVDQDCDGVADCTGAHRWARVAGDASDQQPGDIATDPSGNVLVAATVAGSIDFGGGVLTSSAGKDFAVAKLDPAGNHVWSRIFGESSAQVATGVAVDQGGNAIVVGTFNSSFSIQEGASQFAFPLTSSTDLFIVKLDPNGKVLWGRPIGGPAADTVSDVEVDANGNVYVIGSHIGAITADGKSVPATADTSSNVLLFRLDGATGQVVWMISAGQAGNQFGRAVAINGSGQLFVAADVVGAINYGCADNPPDAGGGDMLIARLDAATSACSWVQRYGDAAVQNVTRLTTTGDDLIVGAHVRGTVVFNQAVTTDTGALDIAVWKLSPGGVVQWAQRSGGAGAEYLLGLDRDASGNLLVSGSYSGVFDPFGAPTGMLTAQSAFDRYVLKLDPNGAPIWARSYKYSGQTTRVATDSWGRVDLLGDLTNVTNLGGGDIGTPTADFNLLLGQLAP